MEKPVHVPDNEEISDVKVELYSPFGKISVSATYPDVEFELLDSKKKNLQKFTVPWNDTVLQAGEYFVRVVSEEYKIKDGQDFAIEVKDKLTHEAYFIELTRKIALLTIENSGEHERRRSPNNKSI